MYIDFHTHAFNDVIAERAITKLENTLASQGYTDDVPAATRGTIGELLQKMDLWGVDKAVVLNIATKPTQQTVVNNWAKEIQSDRIFCFGSVHPDAEDALDELERIKALGLYGVKLHPDYQGFMVNDEKLMLIYRKCAELGLPVAFHAGFDVVSPDCIHCPPELSVQVLDKVPELTVILAHFGAFRCWNAVEEYLVGRNVYFDISYTDSNISDEQAMRIIRNHGADKILFGSDCPWHAASREKSMLERLPLTEEERELISHINAEKLLDIQKSHK